MSARWLVPAVLALGAALIVWGAPKARAAEWRGIEHRLGWVITLLYHSPTDDNRSHRELSGPYGLRSECRAVAERMMVMVPGGRLRCDFVDELRVIPR